MHASYTTPWDTIAWGVFMSGMAYRWHASGTLVELEGKWGLASSSWLADQHEKLQWDTGYLQGND